jgi:hypothetical protein
MNSEFNYDYLEEENDFILSNNKINSKSNKNTEIKSNKNNKKDRGEKYNSKHVRKVTKNFNN